MRDTTYDARVTPNYQEYVDSPGVCASITESSWDPPSNVVQRWVSLCMAEI